MCMVKATADAFDLYIGRCRDYPRRCTKALRQSSKVCLGDRANDLRVYEAKSLETGAAARQESASKFSTWEVVLLIVGAVGLGFGVGAAAAFVAGR